MPYEFIVVWFEKAKSWLSYTGKSEKLKKEHRRPLNCHVKPFRKLENAKKFQKEFVKPYPHIYQIYDIPIKVDFSPATKITWKPKKRIKKRR